MSVALIDRANQVKKATVRSSFFTKSFPPFTLPPISLH
jgi:hypothetical protein